VEMDLRHDDVRALLQLGAKRLAEVGHFLEIGDVPVVDPLHDLVRTETLLAELFGKEVLKPRTIEVKEVLLGRGLGHCVSGVRHLPWITRMRASMRIERKAREKTGFVTFAFARPAFIRVDPWQKINGRKRPSTGRNTRFRRRRFRRRRSRALHWRRSSRRSRRGWCRRRLPWGWWRPSGRGA